MACLDENTLARLIAHTLDATQAAQAHAHIAGCSACRETLARLLTTSGAASVAGAELSEAPPLLGRGARLGRYEIRELEGVGGMGVVYSATDTMLSRKVALKLLRSRAAGRDRLLGEARALARLAHPAVVAVFDVGFEGEHLFLAMEWIDGVTLSAWLAERPRGRKAVLDAFVAAGRGLVAIHGAGLVHRDFKPHNVLVGADGRVRVTDLGLALEVGAGEASGTPKYMAPEQRRGEPSGPAQDQYSFCVALAEALPGDRSPLQAVLARGRESDPARRFASMQALLDAIAVAERAPFRRGVTAAAALALATGVGVWGWRAAHDDCRTLTLDGAWDDARRAALAQALGPAVAPRALQRLDARADEWRATKASSCSAPPDDDQVLRLERQCLRDRKQELRVRVDVLMQAKDAAFAAKASDALDLMLRATACPAQAVARRRLPASPDSEQAVLVEVREALAAARALASGGDHPAALERAQAALQRAKTSRWAPLELEALSELATVEDQAGRLDDAVRDFSAAGYAAEAQGNDEVAATAWCSLVLVAGYRQGKAEMARHFVQLGRAVLERAGEAPAWAACLSQNTALLEIREGRHGAAAADMQRAVDEATRAWGADDPHTLRAYDILGSALGELGRHGEALAARARVVDGNTKAKGAEHGDVAVAHLRLAESLLGLGRLDEALEHATLAVERQAALVGKEHFRYGIALSIRGSIRSELKDDAGALGDLEAGLAAIRAKQPADSMFVVQPLVAYAEALELAGRPAEAEAAAQRAVELLDAKLEAATPQTAYALVVLGRARRERGRPQLERALEIYRKAGGDCDPAHLERAREALSALQK